MLFAVAIYTQIIQSRGSIESFIVGFGFIIPLALYIPFYLLEELDIQNKALRLSLSTLPYVVFFRCMEAMFKTPSNIVVEVAMGNYVTYYTTLMTFDWSTKTLNRRRITAKELLSAIGILILAFVRISLLLSFMMHFDFAPFKSPVKLDDYHLSLDLLSPAHLGNTYFLGLLTYSYLSMGLSMTAFSEQAKGYYVEPIFLNPMIKSRSCSEFWGERWNLMIHRLLKHGIMRPAKKYFSTLVSVFITFLFSGLAHEFTWAIVFYHRTGDPCATCLDCEHCFHHKPMKVVAFFLYLGMCMMLERPLAPYVGFLKSWPSFIVAQLVLLSGLPVSHWYTGDWALSGKFADFAQAVLFVRKM